MHDQINKFFTQLTTYKQLIKKQAGQNTIKKNPCTASVPLTHKFTS